MNIIHGKDKKIMSVYKNVCKAIDLISNPRITLLVVKPNIRRALRPIESILRGGE